MRRLIYKLLREHGPWIAGRMPPPSVLCHGIQRRGLRQSSGFSMESGETRCGMLLAYSLGRQGETARLTFPTRGGSVNGSLSRLRTKFSYLMQLVIFCDVWNCLFSGRLSEIL